MRLLGALACAAALAGLSMEGAADPAERRSGATFMSPESQALQSDDAANPGMLGVLQGEELWNAPAGEANLSCASCHGVAAESMKGVAARFPAFDEDSSRPIDLQTQVNLCRERRQQAAPLALESPELLALTTYVAHQSRGMPITTGEDRRLEPSRARGEALFRQRFGQLNLACADCHESNWDKRLGSSPITQGHPTGYPVYRLEWQGLGSLQRRFRGCMSGVRADPVPLGAPEWVDLEVFLKVRAAGMPLETPAIRP